MPLSVKTDDGVLIVVRVCAPVTLDDYIGFAADVRHLVSSAPSPVLICTDWRNAGTLGADIQDAFIWMMRRDNPAIGRVAVLVGEGREQAQQMIREAENRRRAVCDDVAGVLSFLESDGPLSEEQVARVREFLS